MSIITQNLSSATLRNKIASDVSNNVEFLEMPVQTSPTINSTETIDDVVYNTVSSMTYYNEGIIIVENSIGSNLTNLTPSVAELSSDGYLSRVSSGVAKIKISESGVSKLLTVDMRNLSTNDTVYEYKNAVSGSLLEHLQNSIDNRINGSLTMNKNGKIFTSQNHTTDTFIRNPHVWCNDIDLTCISPSNSDSNARKAGTLITPRHIAIAAHYEYGVGTKVYFVSQDGLNTVYERTIVSKIRHPNYTPYYPDISICCLNSDLPSNKIKPCRVLPSNWSNYLVKVVDGKPPCLSLDQEEKALITNLFRVGNYISFSYPRSTNRRIFSESIISGDSGNPTFAIINDKLVLLTLWTSGGAGAGTFITPQISIVNQMIADSDTAAGNGGTGYTLTEVDLSGFTDFS